MCCISVVSGSYLKEQPSFIDCELEQGFLQIFGTEHVTQFKCHIFPYYLKIRESWLEVIKPFSHSQRFEILELIWNIEILSVRCFWGLESSQDFARLDPFGLDVKYGVKTWEKMRNMESKCEIPLEFSSFPTIRPISQDGQEQIPADIRYWPGCNRGGFKLQFYSNVSLGTFSFTPLWPYDNMGKSTFCTLALTFSICWIWFRSLNCIYEV